MASLLRLTELYGDKYDRLKPTIFLGEKAITSVDINEAFIKTLPEFQTIDKKWILDKPNILNEDFNFSITGVPNCGEKIKPINAEFIRVIPYEHVKFYNHDTARKLVPRMLINVQNRDIDAGHCVFINTGYAIKFTSSSINNQREFILIPNIVCKDANNKNCKIIPNIYARDEDDCGLFTVSFTLLEGVPSKIQIVFNCYLVGKIVDNCVELHEREPNNDVFKPKDMKTGRTTKNLKIKTHFYSMTRSNNNDYVEFQTYNHLVSPPITWSKQKLRIHKTAVITSRRREWLQADLLTLSGVCVDATNDRVPKVFTREDNHIPNKNTHCVTIIESKAIFHSKNSGVNDYRGLSLINGAFININDNYVKIQKHIKIMNSIIDKFFVYKTIISSMCSGLTHETFGSNVKACNLFRIFDASGSLNMIDEEKLTKSLMTDEEIFDELKIQVVKTTSTLSSTLLNSMYWLTSTFLTNHLSTEELEVLRNKMPTTLKRKFELDESCEYTKKNKTM